MASGPLGKHPRRLPLLPQLYLRVAQNDFNALELCPDSTVFTLPREHSFCALSFCKPDSVVRVSNRTLLAPQPNGPGLSQVIRRPSNAFLIWDCATKETYWLMTWRNEVYAILFLTESVIISSVPHSLNVEGRTILSCSVPGCLRAYRSSRCREFTKTEHSS